MSSSSQPSSSENPSKTATPQNLDEAISRLSSALTLKELWRTASRIGMSADQFETITGESPHRLRRGRGGDEVIDLTKNAPLLRCAKIFRRVVALCNGDEGAARNWLNAPAPMLKNKKPIEAAETVPGAKNVDALVTQLEKAAGLAKN